MSESFDLLSTVEYGGCSAKIPASVLESILINLPKVTDPNVLVDIETHDDAGVYRINDELALIVTIDFFPPICSDAYEFGQIAATNSISDVYAMGGEPFLALNIAMFPSTKIPIEVYQRILEGAASVAKDSGTIIIGGHTIDDYPPKFGLAVIGKVHPNNVITNAGLKPGQKLILTKPLGTGIIVAGKRLEMVSKNGYLEALKWMKTLNADGCKVMQKYSVSGATDITGFGLLGHALKMAKASKVNLNINSQSIPYISESYKLVDDGCIPGAAFRNLEYIDKDVNFQNIDYNLKMIMTDAQTSGGLLMGVKSEVAEEAVKELKNKGLNYTSIIGEITEGEGRINIY
ncbi:MAG: selenide, water dikinase SelD [Bacteroidales bacterium]|nr:MAG: selenide, water dikinase SelD [Bacteroidales bacterium]